MRQLMSQKNVRKYSYRLGLDIVKIMVRGDTGHRKDLCLADGTIINLYPDGEMIKSESKWS